MSAILYQFADGREYGTQENHMMVLFADAGRIQSELLSVGFTAELRTRPMASNERLVKSDDEKGDWFQLVGEGTVTDVAVLLALQSQGPGNWDVVSVPGFPQWKLSPTHQPVDDGKTTADYSGALGEKLGEVVANAVKFNEFVVSSLTAIKTKLGVS